MIAELTTRRRDCAELCRRYGVRRLEVFGSATTESRFDPARSDLDLLVEFGPHETLGPADQYFGLLEELQILFQRSVQLVSARGLRNPYFIRSIEGTKQVLYAS